MKLQRATRIYLALRKEFLDGKPCERCQAAQATEVHHKAGRSGHRLTDVSRWAALCHDCHMHVTANPSEAYEQGWSLRRIGGTT